MSKSVVGEHGVICRLAGERLGYFGWPTVGRMDDGSPQAMVREQTWFEDNPHRMLFDCRRAQDVIGFAPEFDCWQEARLPR